jgi:glycine/D-amino acid oxidase-like deaminating enzyme
MTELESQRAYTAVVIGGGFYGACIALFLSRYFSRIVVIEREPQLLTRASYVNQARLHTGYHYPRSFRTAASSFQNLAVFRDLYEASIESRFRAVYCIARSGSKISRSYFERFCRTLGLPLRPAAKPIVRLFSDRLIDGVYECEESAFNAGTLRRLLSERLSSAGVEVRTGCEVTAVEAGRDDCLEATLGTGEVLRATWIFNCTYANLNQLQGLTPAGSPELRHQLSEVCLVEVPEQLRGLGVTVMDGPFFSVMPFPDRGLHSLTHVRYTHHFSWEERAQPELQPEQVFSDHSKQSNFHWMVRDAQRYLPQLASTRLVSTLFEIKTTLRGTVVDDARPIALHRDRQHHRLISILGGKIDNIFDVLSVLRRELGLPES